MAEDINEKEVIESEKIRYAGFKIRLFAHFIDMFLILVIVVVLFPGMVTSRQPSAEMEVIVHQAISDFQTGVITQKEYLSIVAGQLFGTKALTNSALDAVIAGIIVIIFWRYRSATPGKEILSLKIVDIRTNGRPGTWQLIARYFAYIPAMIPLFLGFLWIAFDRKKQGWHDKMTGTAVIHTKPKDVDAKRKNFKRNTIIAIILLLIFAIFF